MLTDRHLAMLYRTIVLVALGLLFTQPTTCKACDFDLDCDIGSTCRNGICIGGLWPGNDNDDAPLSHRDRPMWDLNESYGDTCEFDIDCGIGMRCAKRRGALEGVCVRGR